MAAVWESVAWVRVAQGFVDEANQIGQTLDKAETAEYERDLEAAVDDERLQRLVAGEVADDWGREDDGLG